MPPPAPPPKRPPKPKAKPPDPCVKAIGYWVPGYHG